MYTFNPASDVEVTIFINSPNVPRVQPSIVINGLLTLLLIVQVTHKHMTTIHTDLYMNFIVLELIHWEKKKRKKKTTQNSHFSFTIFIRVINLDVCTIKALTNRAEVPGIDSNHTYGSCAFTHSVHIQDGNVDPHEKLNGTYAEGCCTRQSHLHTVQAKLLTNLAQDQPIYQLKLPGYRLSAVKKFMDQSYGTQ